jgi:NTP pyrophosphatase (non-canonical NTP hydrolase)
MDLNTYQERALRTAGENRGKLGYAAAKMTEEAIEFSGPVNKHVYHGHPLDRTAALKELGDLLWYVAHAAEALKASLEDVAVLNLDKLAKRYPSGKFTTEDSVARRDSIPTGKEEAP